VQGCTLVSAAAADDNGVHNALTRMDLIVVDGHIYLQMYTDDMALRSGPLSGAALMVRVRTQGASTQGGTLSRC